MSELFAPPQTILYSSLQHLMAAELPDWQLVAAVDSGAELPEKVVVLQTEAAQDTEVSASWAEDDSLRWTLTATLNAVAPTDLVDSVSMQLHRFLKRLRGKRYTFEGGSALYRSVVAQSFFSPTGQYALPGGKQLTQVVGQFRISMEVL